ncbi:MAG: hypothetical protein PHI85_02955 [Victivallaceae bacterium]|nr:hypothetical protein [Victivallaceae bacterium]
MNMGWLSGGFRMIDVAVILVYLALSLILGMLGSRLLGLSGNKEEDYFLAGRKMPGWLNGLSNAATALNSDVAPLYCGVALAAGLSGAWFYLSRFGFGMLIVSLLFAAKWRQMRIRTGPEFFSLRYGHGSKAARVYSSVYTVLLGMIPWIGAGIVGMDKVAGPIFNYNNIWITVAVILPLLTIYVWSAGFGGVLITDGMQGVVIIIGNLVLVVAVLAAFGGPSGMGKALHDAYAGRTTAELKSLSAAPGFFEVVNPDGSVIQLAIYPEYQSGYFNNVRNAEKIKFTPSYTGDDNRTVTPEPAVASVDGFVIEETVYAPREKRPARFCGTSPQLVAPGEDGGIAAELPGDIIFSRNNGASNEWIVKMTGAAENAAESYGSSLSSSLPVPGNAILGPLGVICWLLISVVGVGGGVASDGQRYFSCKNNYEAAKVGLWGNVALFGMLLLLMLPVLGMLARYPETHFIASGGLRENIYGRMLIEFLPEGAVGITVAAMLASVMSTVSSHLNYGSQTLLNDVYRPLLGEPKAGREVWVGRLLMLGIVALSVVVTVHTESLMGITTVVVGLFGSSATFGWAQWWWWRVNLKGWLASILTGPIFYFLFSKLLPLIPAWAGAMRENGETMAIIQALISMVLSMLCWLVVTLLTKPEDMTHLKEFYLRAHPAGLWGPVRAELIAEGRLPDGEPPAQLLPGFLIAVVGFAMMAAGTLAIATLFIGNYAEVALYTAATIVTGLIFKRLFRWHLRRLGADVDFYGNPESVETP